MSLRVRIAKIRYRVILTSSMIMEAKNASPNHDIQSPEVTSRAAASSDEVHNRVKNLTQKLSAALVNVSAKDDLVMQHAKVAEEAVAGWEKAENEVVVLKQQLEASLQKNLALEDHASHLDGALKECVRQLRQAREEQERKIHEALVKKNQDWEATKSELETQLLELQIQVKASTAESPATVDPDLCHKLDLLENENSALKLELFSRTEELGLTTIERDLSTLAAETASKQHLESIKKMAKLEAECCNLKSVVRKSSFIQDQKSVAASPLYVDSLTDSQSDSGARLNAVEIDTRNMSSLEVTEFEPSCSDSWASDLIAELDQFKNEKAIRNLTASRGEIDLMDDFLEMERLAAVPQTEIKNCCLESEAAANRSVSCENPLRAELEVMHRHTTELEEKLGKMEAKKAEVEKKLENIEEEKSELEQKLKAMEAEKAELEEKLEDMEAEKGELEEKLDRMGAERAEFEMDLTESQDCIKASQVQLEEAEMKLWEMQRELHVANEKKQFLESQLVGIEVEVRTMTAKVDSLEAEVEKERALSAEIAIKYRELEDELSRKKQEDLVVAAGKLAECQQTIVSLGNQLKSLATLEDFLIDTTNITEFSEEGSFLTRADGEVWSLHSNDPFLAKKN